MLIIYIAHSCISYPSSPTTSKVPTPLLFLLLPPRPNSPIHQLKQIPLPSPTLRLEVPKHPAVRPGFKRLQLRCNVARNIALIVLRPLGHGAGFARARGDIVGAFEGAVEAGTSVEAVEVGCAVREGGGPFAYDWGRLEGVGGEGGEERTSPFV